jgi:CHAT domain-containing protein
MLNDELLAFVYHAGQLCVVRELCRQSELDALLARLQSQWDRLRVGRDFVAPHIGRLERSARRLLQQLYDLVFAKIAPHLPPDGDLIIVPHGALHSFPFHALHTGTDYLIDHFAISYAPSVTVLQLCGQRPAFDGAVLGMGSDGLGLVAVSAELAALQTSFPDATVLRNERATSNQLMQHLPANGLLHIATHGLFRADNPRFSALKLHDGWLTAGDIAALVPAPVHVTLSACDSGRSQLLAGDESFGLMRAFLAAGVASLFVTQWLVQDDIAAEMMQQWYADIAVGTPGVTALRTAQRTIRAHHPHPYYWATFAFVGRRTLHNGVSDAI